jgi:phage tail-like protein
MDRPLTGFRFVLELGFVEAGAFSECTGLAAETKVLEYKEGGRNYSALKFAEGGAVSNVVLKRGVLAGSAADALFRWHEGVATGAFGHANTRPTDPDEDIDRNVAVVLQGEDGAEIKRWRLFRAFPVKWVGPDLKAMASEVAMETLELAHEGLLLD